MGHLRSGSFLQSHPRLMKKVPNGEASKWDQGEIASNEISLTVRSISGTGKTALRQGYWSVPVGSSRTDYAMKIHPILQKGTRAPRT